MNRACDILGSKSALARAVGVKPPTVQQWCNGERPVPPKKCIEIERATDRKVRVEELLPGYDWAFIRSSVQGTSGIDASDDVQPPVGGTNKGRKMRAAGLQECI